MKFYQGILAIISPIITTIFLGLAKVEKINKNVMEIKNEMPIACNNASGNFANNGDLIGLGEVATAVASVYTTTFGGIVKFVTRSADAVELLYKNHVIPFTNKNREPLTHLVRKRILTNEPKTKAFLDKIFQLYEKNNIEISMAALRICEFLDDGLLKLINFLSGLFIFSDDAVDVREVNIAPLSLKDKSRNNTTSQAN